MPPFHSHPLQLEKLMLEIWVVIFLIMGTQSLLSLFGLSLWTILKHSARLMPLKSFYKMTSTPRLMPSMTDGHPIWKNCKPYGMRHEQLVFWNLRATAQPLAHHSLLFSHYMASTLRSTVRYWTDDQFNCRFVSFATYQQALDYVTKFKDLGWRAEIAPPHC